MPWKWKPPANRSPSPARAVPFEAREPALSVHPGTSRQGGPPCHAGPRISSTSTGLETSAVGGGAASLVPALHVSDSRYDPASQPAAHHDVAADLHKQLQVFD